MKFLIWLILMVTAATAWPTGASAQVSGARVAPRGGQPENRWRYVWHNDRWWYWTAENRWAYFNGRRWIQYDPRRPSTGALAAGYRRAPAFERPPAMPPRPPMSVPGEAVQGDAGLVDLFDLGRPQGGATSGGLLLPSPGTTGAAGARSGLGESGGAGGRIRAGGMSGAGRTGGGGFGGPTGSSLGAGSAAGGASTPH